MTILMNDVKEHMPEQSKTEEDDTAAFPFQIVREPRLDRGFQVLTLPW